MLQITGNKPLPGVMFGVTHTPEGAPIIREAKVLKVGIGVPKGKGLNVWMETGQWWGRLALGKKSDGRPDYKTGALGTRAKAEAFYKKYYPDAFIVGYPQKLRYFTFTKPVTQDDGSEVFEPDWDAIEAHGDMPSEIDIVFLDDNPFNGGYQMWSKSALLCRGDGVVAERRVDFAIEKGTAEEKAAAMEAQQAGQKFFPIVNNCWLGNCRFAQDGGGCKPGADLKFQLPSNIRIGGTAYFHSTGMRSISQTFSALERIKSLTGGRIAGIPLKMVLRSYVTRHDNKPATQYGVSLEFRAEDIQSVRKNLIEQAWKFRELASMGPLQQSAQGSARHYIDAPTGGGADDGDDYDEPVPGATADEFYPEAEDFDEQGGKPARSSSAEAATNAKTAELSEKLAKQQRRKKEEPKPAEAPAPAPEPPAQSAAPAAAEAPVEPEPYRDESPEDPEDDRFKRREGDLF